MDILDLIGKIGEKENTLTEREFVSPIFFGDTVATRVSGMIYKLKIAKVDPGWYVLKAKDTHEACVIRPAEYDEIDTYLKKLDRIHLVIITKEGHACRVLPMKSNKFGFLPTEVLPAFLIDDVPVEFDRIIGRFDGANIWYEAVDVANDPSKGEYLRDALGTLIDPKDIKYSGLTFEEKAAYSIRFSIDKKIKEELWKKTVVGSVQKDVEHAGGIFQRVEERKDHLQVTYVVDGHQYTSTVAKTMQHNVISAGICLSGMDRDFDLKSLITVMREGQHRRLIHRW